MAQNGHNVAIFLPFCHYFGSCDHIYGHFRHRLHPKTRETCVKVVWGYFCPLQAYSHGYKPGEDTSNLCEFCIYRVFFETRFL